MKTRVVRVLAGLLLGLSCAGGRAEAVIPVPILFDTDMETDCDDAGALAVLHSLADRGECRILATVVSVRDPDSVATVAAINRYYGRPNLPLGFVRGTGVLEKSKFAKQIATEFPHGISDFTKIPDAADTYRQVLEEAQDHSVIVVTVGYLTNLRNLLRQPASEGHASGADLIRRKVRSWVCMGGNFIGNPPRDDLKLGNVNFLRDPTSALDVITQWPGTVTFAGREVCSVPSGLAIGESLQKASPLSPVRRAYECYFGGTAKNRHVADLATVLFAVRGAHDLWDVSEPGAMRLRPDMTFDWEPIAGGTQRYLLKKRRDGQPNDRAVEAALDELLTQGPQSAPVTR